MSHIPPSESNGALGPDQDLCPSHDNVIADVAPNIIQGSRTRAGIEGQAASPSPPPPYATLPPGCSVSSGIAGQGSYIFTEGFYSQPYFHHHSHPSSSATIFPSDPRLFLNSQPHSQPHNRHQERRTHHDPHSSFYPYPNAHHVHPAQTFGPTPISAMTTMTTLPILPYAFYESPGAADSRARWRFMSAVLVALTVYAFVGFVIGLEVLGERLG